MYGTLAYTKFRNTANIEYAKGFQFWHGKIVEGYCRVPAKSSKLLNSVYIRGYNKK